jgi:hypothetical protein
MGTRIRRRHAHTNRNSPAPRRHPACSGVRGRFSGSVDLAAFSSRMLHRASVARVDIWSAIESSSHSTSPFHSCRSGAGVVLRLHRQASPPFPGWRRPPRCAGVSSRPRGVPLPSPLLQGGREGPHAPRRLRSAAHEAAGDPGAGATGKRRGTLWGHDRRETAGDEQGGGCHRHRCRPDQGRVAAPTLRVARHAARVQNPANKHKSVSLTAEKFRYSFGNAISEEESNQLHEK